MKLNYFLVILILLGGLQFGQEFQKFAQEDLDGDGRKEQIRLEILTEDGQFLLQIDAFSVEGKADYEVDGFLIVDLDQGDRFKEVAVHTPGESSDDHYILFWWDGKKIAEAGQLRRWPDFVGNGIVYVDDWKGFWKKRNKYRLDPLTHTLQLVPQEFFYVGVKVKVKTAFGIFASRELQTPLALLRVGSEIEILLCKEATDFNDDCYLIRTSSGLLGWAKFENFFDKVEGLPLAD